MKICVGLTGPNASGKGEVSLYLAGLGFSRHSLSDVVREEATRQGLDHSRDSLIKTGTLLREDFGPGILAERILPFLAERSVVDSIRNPGEIQVFRRIPGFILLGVDAPIRLRFERSRLRARSGDGLSLDEFGRKEAMEQAQDGPGQQLQVCLSLADVMILNDGTLEELGLRVRQALAAREIDLR